MPTVALDIYRGNSSPGSADRRIVQPEVPSTKDDTICSACHETANVLLSLAESPPSVHLTDAVDVPAPVLGPIVHFHKAVPEEATWASRPFAFDTVPEW